MNLEKNKKSKKLYIIMGLMVVLIALVMVTFLQIFMDKHMDKAEEIKKPNTWTITGGQYEASNWRDYAPFKPGIYTITVKECKALNEKEDFIQLKELEPTIKNGKSIITGYCWKIRLHKNETYKFEFPSGYVLCIPSKIKIKLTLEE